MPLTDDERDLMARFESATLANSGFHHADHVRMAFIYLRLYSPIEALQRFSSTLARFAAANGKPGLYNETITWAFLFLIHERMARAGGELSWAEFAAQNPDLLTWKDNVLKKYYRAETLSSDLARTVFVLPDNSGA
jgi:hypothetical protein